MMRPYRARHTARPAPPRPLRRARWSTAACFAVCGAAWGTWTARLATLEHVAGLGNAQLGLTLLWCPGGLLAAMRVMPMLVGRMGSARLCRYSILVLAAALAALAAARSAAALGSALFAVGAATGWVDGTMNTQGVAVERAYGRPVMTGLHATYSAGALAGALGGSLAARAGAGLLPQFTITAAVLAAGGLIGARWLLGSQADVSAPSAALARRPGEGAALLAVGLVAAVSLMAEGAADNWGSVFVRTALHGSLAVAPLAPAGASGGMLASRLVGDNVIGRYGPRAVLPAAAGAAGAGLILTLVTHSIPVTIAGYIILGAGCAPLVPIAYTAAGALPGMPPAQAMARVTTMGYGGLLSSPVIIGLVAARTSLAAALAIPALLLLGVAATAMTAGDIRRGEEPRNTRSNAHSNTKGADVGQHRRDSRRERAAQRPT